MITQILSGFKGHHPNITEQHAHRMLFSVQIVLYIDQWHGNLENPTSKTTPAHSSISLKYSLHMYNGW